MRSRSESYTALQWSRGEGPAPLVDSSVHGPLPSSGSVRTLSSHALSTGEPPPNVTMRERLRSTMLHAVNALSFGGPTTLVRSQRPPTPRPKRQYEWLETRIGSPVAGSVAVAIQRSLPGYSGVPIASQRHVPRPSANMPARPFAPPFTSRRWRCVSSATVGDVVTFGSVPVTPYVPVLIHVVVAPLNNTCQITRCVTPVTVPVTYRLFVGGS